MTLHTPTTFEVRSAYTNLYGPHEYGRATEFDRWHHTTHDTARERVMDMFIQRYGVIPPHALEVFDAWADDIKQETGRHE